MKRPLISLLVISLFAFVQVAGAHEPPGELLVAVQFPEGLQPSIDGLTDDWAMVPLEQYGTFSENLFSIHGFAGDVGRGELDASSLQISHLVGWNEATNNIYTLTTVFDDMHTVRRVDLGKFFWDDSFEIELNPLHQAQEDLNLNDMRTNFSHKFALPPLEGTFEWIWSRDIEWPTSGSKWLEVGHSFDGEEFGESTYYYELRLFPIDQVPLGPEATEAQVEEHNLAENEMIHITLTVNEVDGGDGNETPRTGMWSTNPIQCCFAGNDLLLAPIDPSIEWPDAPTAVEATSWGRIKAQF